MATEDPIPTIHLSDRDQHLVAAWFDGNQDLLGFAAEHNLTLCDIAIWAARPDIAACSPPSATSTPSEPRPTPPPTAPPPSASSTASPSPPATTKPPAEPPAPSSASARPAPTITRLPPTPIHHPRTPTLAPRAMSHQIRTTTIYRRLHSEVINRWLRTGTFSHHTAAVNRDLRATRRRV